MRIVTVWILLACVFLSGVFALAQDEIDLGYVLINNPFNDNLVCTVEEALAFYEELDEFPALIDAIADIDSGPKLFLWAVRFSRWANAAEQTCYGTGNATVALERHAQYIAIQHMIGEEAILPEENAYTRARDMSTIDRESLAADKTISEEELAINLVVSEVPLCTVERAMAFYATFDEFYVESIDLGLVTDEASLGDWATQFYAWSEENWAPLQEEPCGQMKSFIDFLESFAYGTALAQLTIAGQQTLNAFDDTMEILYDWIGEEMDWLEETVDA
ncbi:MAG: hypothetical protein OXG60_09520 [Chloroflexi bacterium]|nr:hypothetical protein [Chloroflexota bacterium]